MTIKPKASKFRIRRPEGGEGPASGAESEAPRQNPQPEEDHGDLLQQPEPEMMAQGAPQPSDQDLKAIEAEGLTTRQLRMARRLAMKHGLDPDSDLDAVRQLRAKGIDPFHRDNMLELVIGGDAAAASAAPAAATPGTELARLRPAAVAKKRPDAGLPSTDFAASDSQVQQILAIQQGIAKRRQRRLILLAIQLFFFVGLPTILAGTYYYRIATPMYSTQAEFVIQQADAQSSGMLGGLFSGTGMATSQDSITVQSYLQSRDAMLRLDRDHGFKAHFSQEHIDPIHRLSPNATNEAAYKLYRRKVKIGYDPTEGIIKMEVIAADPQVAATYAASLISYAEELVDQLTSRLRADQMAGARESFEEAEAAMLAAQRRVVDLQESYNVLSSELEVGLISAQISGLETQLTQDRLSLQEIMANPNPSRARVEPLQRRITSLETEIAALRSRLTQGSGDAVSIARVSSELLVAESDVQVRQMMLAQALQQLEVARLEANRQVRYLSAGVSPVAPDEAAYPQAFENTMLVFMIFGGIYLLLSMTASILREQVSA